MLSSIRQMTEQISVILHWDGFRSTELLDVSIGTKYDHCIPIDCKRLKPGATLFRTLNGETQLTQLRSFELLSAFMMLFWCIMNRTWQRDVNVVFEITHTHSTRFFVIGWNIASNNVAFRWSRQLFWAVIQLLTHVLKLLEQCRQRCRRWQCSPWDLHISKCINVPAFFSCVVKISRFILSATLRRCSWLNKKCCESCKSSRRASRAIVCSSSCNHTS